MGSSRLPGKVLLDLGGRSVLELMLALLKRSETLSEAVVATSNLQQDEAIVRVCESLAVGVFRGSETDVLSRYVGAARAFDADVVVRLTADCPFVCPEVTDGVVRAFHNASPSVHYASNCLRRTYPRGLDTEVVDREMLEAVSAQATEAADREHVTLFIRRQPTRFRHLSVEDGQNRSALRWTLDTDDDYRLLTLISRALGDTALTSTYRDLLSLFDLNPEWADINAHVEQKVP